MLCGFCRDSRFYRSRCLISSGTKRRPWQAPNHSPQAAVDTTDSPKHYALAVRAVRRSDYLSDSSIPRALDASPPRFVAAPAAASAVSAGVLARRPTSRISQMSGGANEVHVRPSRSQRNPLCAYKAHSGIVWSVPTSVPKRGPMTIMRQPTPTKAPIKNGPEIINFGPVLGSPAALANRRLRPLGHLTADAKCT